MQSKCPVCGERLTGDIDGVVVCWSGCSFRCGGYALPRIAAAMELAMAHNGWSEESGDADAYNRLNRASQRVLEVFGGK
jgi:hypothetical protein